MAYRVLCHRKLSPKCLGYFDHSQRRKQPTCPECYKKAESLRSMRYQERQKAAKLKITVKVLRKREYNRKLWHRQGKYRRDNIFSMRKPIYKVRYNKEEDRWEVYDDRARCIFKSYTTKGAARAVATRLNNLEPIDKK